MGSSCRVAIFEPNQSRNVEKMNVETAFNALPPAIQGHFRFLVDAHATIRTTTTAHDADVFKLHHTMEDARIHYDGLTLEQKKARKDWYKARMAIRTGIQNMIRDADEEGDPHGLAMMRSTLNLFRITATQIAQKERDSASEVAEITDSIGNLGISS